MENEERLQEEELDMTILNEKVYDKQAFLIEFEESVKEMTKLREKKRDKSKASSWRDMLSEKE